MFNAVSPRFKWARHAAANFNDAVAGDTDSTSKTPVATLTVNLLCSLLDNESTEKNSVANISHTGYNVPVHVLVQVISCIRRRLAPHSSDPSSPRGYEWDATCAIILQSCLCPGSLRSTWGRRFLEILNADWNSIPGSCERDGTATKLYNEAASVLDAVVANSIYRIRRGLQANSLEVSLLHQRDEFGWTLLHHAAYGNCVDSIRYLITEGLSPNSVSFTGTTVLHVAAARMHIDAVSLLLQSGGASSLAAIDCRGDSPLDAFLNTIALSCWQLRLSPVQVADTAVLLMKDHITDIWRVRLPCAAGGTGRQGVSLFLRLLLISDASVAHTVVSIALESLKLINRLHNHSVPSLVEPTQALWPISERVRSGIARQKAARGSDIEPVLPSSRILSSEEYISFVKSIKAQVQVAVALSLKRKRVRILQLLVQTFDPLLQLFDRDAAPGIDPPSISGDSDAVESRCAFFFRCLELAVVTKCLRTIIVMMDLGKERGYFILDKERVLGDVCVPSCFLNLVIAQSDPLLIRLVLERLGPAMDTWVMLPPTTMHAADKVEIDAQSEMI